MYKAAICRFFYLRQFFILTCFIGGMDKVSFTSRIRLVSLQEFRRTAFQIDKKKFVSEPWTIKESVLGDSAYTSDILDCTVCGLTDGQKVLLTHICPTNPKNKSFNKIEEFITKKINLSDKYLQGFILGSKPNNINSPNSTKLFDKFVEFMQKYEIPFSRFKGGLFENHVAYSSKHDEWLIGNCVMTDGLKEIYKNNPKTLFNRIFDEVEISDLDEICL